MEYWLNEADEWAELRKVNHPPLAAEKVSRSGCHVIVAATFEAHCGYRLPLPRPGRSVSIMQDRPETLFLGEVL
jgi:hypothetical protein